MSEQNTFTGKVVHVGQTETIGEKGFQKRILVVSDGHPEYEQQIPFEFTQSNTDKLNNVKEGDEVTVAYNLRGSEYKGRWYANLTGWKVDVLSSSGAAAKPAQPKVVSKQEAVFNEEDDSLPF